MIKFFVPNEMLWHAVHSEYTADVSSSTDLTQCSSMNGFWMKKERYGGREKKQKDYAHIVFIQTTRKLSHTNSKSLQICFGAEDHHSKEFHIHSRKD